MSVAEYTFGSRGYTKLVHDDRDRFTLQEFMVDALGERLLAYCWMDTHGHVLAEGDHEKTNATVGLALRRYARYFNKTGRGETLLRGPVQTIPANHADDVRRKIRYIHKNPLVTTPPLVEKAVDFPWSSARAFAGFSRAPFPNVARATALMGRRLRLQRRPRAEPLWLTVPTADPGLVLAAIAQTYGISPDVIRSHRKEAQASLPTARRTAIFVGRLEGYTNEQLAPVLARTSRRLQQIIKRVALDHDGASIAVTLLRTHPFRGWLRDPGAPLELRGTVRRVRL